MDELNNYRDYVGLMLWGMNFVFVFNSEIVLIVRNGTAEPAFHFRLSKIFINVFIFSLLHIVFVLFGRMVWFCLMALYSDRNTSGKCR